MRVWRADSGESATVASLIAEFGAWWGNATPPPRDLRASVERIMAGGDGEFLLGAVAGGGEPAGVCQLRFRWSVWKSAQDCWLEDLYVREGARRSGLGRALVEAAVERAREHGAQRIELDVKEDNAPARRLYEACGFQTEWKGSGRTLMIGRAVE